MHPQTSQGRDCTKVVPGSCIRRGTVSKFGLALRDDGARLGRWVVLGLVALVLGCGESKDLPNAVNSAPEILEVVADPEQVVPGGTAEVRCLAQDAESDAITYEWTTSVGRFLGTPDDAEVTWEAPADFEGTATITVVATDSKEDSAPAGTTIQVVGERGVLSGAVTRAGTGEGLDGALVAVAGLSAVTDGSGAYEIEGVPLGNHEVVASLDGFQSSARTFEIKSGPNTLNFTLTQLVDLGTVSGTVRNSVDAPVAGAVCRLVGQDLEQETDATGAFTFTSVPRGSVTLQVSRAGYQLSSTTRDLSGAELAIDVVLTAERPAAPANVRVTKSGLDLEVGWDPPLNDTVVGFQVYWKVDTEPTVAVPNGRLDADTPEIAVVGEEDRRYRFLVAAINVDGVEGSDLGISNDVVLTALSAWVGVPAGSVVMGDAVPGQPADREVPHPGNPVTVPAFRIEQTEVTNQQFFMFLWEATSSGFAEILGGEVRVDGNPLILLGASKIRLDGNVFTVPPEFARHPVTGVTWYGADAYARFYGRRLPTEAEWERAARGSSTASGVYPGSEVGYGTRFPWGNEPPTIERANFGQLVGGTRPVASMAQGATPHWSGPIYELAGNVWEWCADWLDAYRAPHVPPSTGTRRVVRGGSLDSGGDQLAVWARFSGEPQTTSPHTGFRCAGDSSSPMNRR